MSGLAGERDLIAPAGSGATLERSDGKRARIIRRLVLSSALMLFVELWLIRWAGSNVVHLSYFSNFLLLGSFLGIGLGFLRSRADRGAPFYSVVALGLLVAFVTSFPVTVNRSGGEVIYFTSLTTTGLPIWITLPVLFLVTAAVLAGPGELVAGCFRQLPRLDAYRYDLVGSLAGIGLFTLLSYLGAPPVVWGLLAGAGYVLLFRPYGQIPAIVALLMCVLLAGESMAANTFWSPYYKITTTDDGDGTGISVNGIPHQRVTTAERRQREESLYATPYQRIDPGRPLNDVLIVGAGSGTDVAIALRRGAWHVDAVEIDPGLRRIGVERNPDKAYQDPRVTSHIDDGRAFLERTGKRYDLILFALPDSLTLVQGASSLRLESYLFTREAFASARSHLKPGGAFALYNFYREGWLVDRLAGTANEVFGHPPCLDLTPEAWQLGVITAGRDPGDQRCERTWTPAASAPEPATDDRPFLYLKDRVIPGLYLVTLALILIASLVAVRLVGGPLRWMRSCIDLFLLGAAFMLLETKSVTGFALLFGTTWVVNAIVFAGVLLAVLASVEVTRRFRTPPVPVMYGVLGAGLLLAWLVPASALLALPVPLRLVAAVSIAFLPIFAGNIVFTKRFAATPDPATAFAANLLGAMAGGCLEYLGLITGHRNLLILAALLYLGALTLQRRRVIW